jgi:hypothetical protein
MEIDMRWKEGLLVGPTVAEMTVALFQNWREQFKLTC